MTLARLRGTHLAFKLAYKLKEKCQECLRGWRREDLTFSLTFSSRRVEI